MPLPRLQLFEFNDLDWMPRAVRDTVVESLSNTLVWGRVLEGLVEPFEAFLAASGASEVLDLGSGGAGPARILARAMVARRGAAPRFLLSDLHPRPEVWAAARAELPGALDFVAEPVDATCIPEPLAKGRARTLINILHHLPPELAGAVLADAVRGSRGVFVAEGFERNPLRFAAFSLAGLPALALNPLLSPRDRLAKAALTWLSPAALTMGVWDGLVSTLRVYTEAELRQMVARAGPAGAGWRWVYGTWPFFPFGRGYYFYGTPPYSPPP